MRGLALAAALLIALSGCASDDGKTDTPTDTETGSNTTTTPTTSGTATSRSQSTTSTTSNPPGNEAPTATLEASVPGGPAPLNVTFTLRAADKDGDSLSWTLDADGDGTVDRRQAAPATFPATATFTYAATGAYTAVYAVTDGKATETVRASINVTSGAPAIVLSGHISAADPAAAGGQGCQINVVALLGVSNFGDTFDLPDNAPGGTYSVDPPSVEVDWYTTGYEAFIESGSSGTVPDDAGQATTCGTDPALADFDYTLTIRPK